MLTGRIQRATGRWWSAHCPIGGVFTQGKSRTDAKAMLADALEALVDRRGFRVYVTDLGRGGDVLIEANDPAPLFAHVLRYQRSVNGLSLAQVAAKLGASSRNAYARYEQARAVPKIDTLYQLLRAAAPNLALTFVERVPEVGHARAKRRTVRG